MNVNHAFAGLRVSDRDRAVVWYEKLFGRPPDILPNDDEAMWQVTESANLYLLADNGRAGAGILTLAIGDLDTVLRGVSARGIVSEPIQEIPGAGRKAVLIDPDGNAVSLVEIFQAK